MKILILLGSNRINGNTRQIIDLMSEHLQHEAARQNIPLELETLFLGKDSQFCRGCRTCFDRGEQACPVKDSLSTIKDTMLSAEGLILASPVYLDDVSAVTKNYFDRLCHLCHRPQFADKIAYVVATSGSSRTSKTLAQWLMRSVPGGTKSPAGQGSRWEN